MGGWRTAEKRVAIEWLAGERSMDAFLDVPVAQPGWRGWPADAKRHSFGGILIEGSGQLCEFDDAAFEDATDGRLAMPLLTWGYADRPALGDIAAKTAMLSRSFPKIGLIRPAVLVAFGKETPNTAPAYFERGIELIPVPESLL